MPCNIAGQEAGGIVCYHPDHGFNSARRFGYVRDNFTKPDVMDTLPGSLAIGHVRYSTAGSKGATAIRDVQPFFGEFSMGGCAIAHNGNLTNAIGPAARTDRARVDLPVLLGQRMHHPPDGAVDPEDPVGTDQGRAAPGGRRVFGRRHDPHQADRRPRSRWACGRWCWAGSATRLGAVLGNLRLDIIGADFVREIEPGEMVVIEGNKVDSTRPFAPAKSRFCIFENVYFSRPDSIIGGRSVYETRRQIGVELAREAPVDADLVCPVPDSGTPAAIGYSQESGIPYAHGDHPQPVYGPDLHRTDRPDPQHGRAAQAERQPRADQGQAGDPGRRFVVRGTTSRKIKDMILEAGAAEVHFRIASPPTAWPCFYGVDTPERSKLLAATMSRRRDARLDRRGQPEIHLARRPLPRRGRGRGPRSESPRFCDACFSGDYPVAPSDKIEEGFQMKAAE
jgi:amidophosphoribosyltransferase